MLKNVIRPPRFLKQLSKLDKSYLERAEKLILKIINNPEIGKPMKFERRSTREVYLPPFRISYSYNKTEKILVFLNIYHKKHQ